MRELLGLLVFIFAGPSAIAASCCGGGGGAQIITGDFRSTFGLEAKHGSVIGDVDSQNESTFRHPKNSETSNSFSVRGAYQIGERTQAGVTVPYVQRNREIGSRAETSYGLGDIIAFGAFEWLPEKEYSRWKPRGFVTLRSTFPTAPSVYDFESDLGADARGQGLYLFALGMPFSKIMGRWDWWIGPEIETGPRREISGPNGRSTTVEPGVSYLLLLSGGLSPVNASAWRFGASLAPRFESPKRVNGVESSSKMVWTSGVSAHYAFDSLTAAGIAYSDQTLFGPARNTTLERSVALTLELREAL